MNYLWLLLIPYCAIAYGIHGGEAISGINRQVRNLICALPFLIVSWVLFSGLPSWQQYSLSILFGAMAYLGTNLGFDNHRLWVKGLLTCFPLGALALPLAYKIGKIAAQCEYLSGAFYGLVLFGMIYIRQFI